LMALAFFVSYVVLRPSCEPGDVCQHPALPGGPVFEFFVVLVGGRISGSIVGAMRLPPLLGNLIAGYASRNFIPNQLTTMSGSMNSTLRNVALAIIMLRAGMGLDLQKLKASLGTMILAVVPCVGAATTIAVFGKVLWSSMSWPFCFMLGFCIADVSPAVTTPILLDLMDKKRGVKKGVPTILLAAGSVNSVMAIVFYSITTEFAWTTDTSPESLVAIIGLKFFVQIFGVGCGAGWLMGKATALMWRLTENTAKKSFIVFSMSMLNLFGFKIVGMSGGGTLAVLMMGTTLHNSIPTEDLERVEGPVNAVLQTAWANCGSVMLFTLLGASLDRQKFQQKFQQKCRQRLYQNHHQNHQPIHRQKPLLKQRQKYRLRYR